MPAPTVTCFICSAVVTKRSTLAFGDRGRACRTHPELQAFIDAERFDAEQAKRWAAAERNLNVLMIVSAVRVTSAMHGLPTGILLLMFKERGYPPDVIAEAQKEIETLGPMSAKEVGEAVLTGFLMMERANA